MSEMEVTETSFVDEKLYNRQLYVIGDDAMKSLCNSEVLLFGMGGLGSEIAKNLVLMGVKQLSVYDEKITTLNDIGLNCFLTNDSVIKGLTRAEAACSKIQELNPYVIVSSVNQPLSNDEFKKYSVVILTETNLDRCLEIDEYCHSLNPTVKVIMADVFGLVSWVFCDFGHCFEVTDRDGEEIKEITISDVTSGKNGKVTVTNIHNYETGDLVTLSDILGMDSLNETTHKIQVLSPKTFTFDTLTNNPGLGNYIRGGMCKLVKQPLKITSRPLKNDIWDPKYENIDSGKDEPAKNAHLSMLAIHKYIKNYGNYPDIRNVSHAETVISLAKELNLKLKTPLNKINERFLRKASFVSQGQLPAICAFLGGIVAQEAVKAVTHKFTPLSQWLHYDALELHNENKSSEEFLPVGLRYDNSLICLGKEVMDLLANTKIFMIGCGAIGSELLKNYAMLGISTQKGKIVITDHDLIEKSNLNRQFLFRNHDIQKPKSSIAANAILEINPNLNITAYQTKVCSESKNIYTEEFFEAQNIVVNALDNLESRRYIDGRCVVAERPLLESGTMGCKGHVQVILPYLTENYTAQSDPLDNDYPYCTIRSFPTQIEHAAQWAKEKFYTLFELKPARCLKFLMNNDAQKVIATLSSGGKVDDIYHVNRDLTNRPKTFLDCLLIARLKFEKYFNHKAKNLLHFFPEDKVVEDGDIVTTFWQSPRRPPHPLNFDINNELHYLFVLSMAKLLAKAWNVPQTTEGNNVYDIIQNTKVPEFRPKDVLNIVTDESVVAPDPMQVDPDENTTIIAKEFAETVKDLGTPNFVSLSYDKDLDSHLDFVYAATNLRATMYRLPNASRARVKKITGRIIPAISSTTSAVAGLVTVELIKVVMKLNSKSDYRNWFLNLAISSYVSAEPAPPIQTELGPGVKYSYWDKWCFYGPHDITLQRVLEMALEKSKLNPSMLVQGSRIVWWPILPGHTERVFKNFKELVDIEPNAKFVDLSFTFEVDELNDVSAPLIRLYFQD